MAELPAPLADAPTRELRPTAPMSMMVQPRAHVYIAEPSGMPERRYSDDEVQKILELATQADAVGPHGSTPADGLTLADIQSIAIEVGVAPDAVARAAESLDTAPAMQTRMHWGMPIGVGRTVPLPRAPTDHEWDQLVAELRATFGARGRVIAQGSLREWAIGNLHALVEPSGDGYRLRLGTVKSDATGINALGAAGAAAGGLLFALVALTGTAGDVGHAPAMLLASGAGAFLANLVRLPPWARRRERQMAHIEARVREIMSASAPARVEAGLPPAPRSGT